MAQRLHWWKWVVVGRATDGALDLVGGLADVTEDAAKEGASGLEESGGGAEGVDLVSGEEAVAAFIAEELELVALIGGEVVVVGDEGDHGHGAD